VPDEPERLEQDGHLRGQRVALHRPLGDGGADPQPVPGHGQGAEPGDRADGQHQIGSAGAGVELRDQALAAGEDGDLTRLGGEHGARLVEGTGFPEPERGRTHGTSQRRGTRGGGAGRAVR
jgi:hypothetical protein